MNCPGCGQDFDPAGEQQTRCSRCVVEIMAALRDAPTASVIAILDREKREGWKSAVSIDQAIDLLNRTLDADPRAVTALFRMRVAVNAAVANDPDIRVYVQQPNEDVTYLGVLGVLNGLFGSHDGWGAISAIQKKGGEGNIERFEKTEIALLREGEDAEEESAP